MLYEVAIREQLPVVFQYYTYLLLTLAIPIEVFHDCLRPSRKMSEFYNDSLLF
jgi:hypothetical protein